MLLTKPNGSCHLTLCVTQYWHTVSFSYENKKLDILLASFIGNSSPAVLNLNCYCDFSPAS